MNKISIIVPIFNAEKTLNRCLDSIIKQTYSNFEVLLLDDGSFDNSFEICNLYVKKDSRFKYFYESNNGVAYTRNKGLENSTGDFICFVDSDDYIANNMLEKLLDNLITFNAELSVCKYTDQAVSYCEPFLTIENDEIYKKFLEGNVITAHLWNKLFKKNLFQNKKFSNYCILEDMDMMYRILNDVSKIIFINEVLYFYTDDNMSSLTKTYNLRSINDFKIAINNMHLFYDDNSKLIKELLINKINTYIVFFDMLAKSNFTLKEIKIYKNDWMILKNNIKQFKRNRFCYRFSKKVIFKIFIININMYLYIYFVRFYIKVNLFFKK